MDTVDVETLRSRIAREIGRDFNYVTASDSARHFDPLSVVSVYGGYLFIAFVTAAGKSLYKQLEAAASKTGDALGKNVGKAIVDLIQGEKPSKNQLQEPEKQSDHIRQITQALRHVGPALTKEELSKFYSEGERALEDTLRSDNLPEEKAKKLAQATKCIIEDWLAL